MGMHKILTRTSLAFLLFTICLWADSDTSLIEFRKFRSWAISGEIGMNSLASLIGPVLSYYPKPEIALDGGVGLSSNGLRPGIRARYLFTPKEKTSFYGGLGLKYGLGSGGTEVKIKDTQSNLDVSVIEEPTAFVDGMLGVEFLANNGFLVIANLGYSKILTSNPYTLTAGTLTEKSKTTFDTIFGSGIMLSVSLGKAF